MLAVALLYYGDGGEFFSHKWVTRQINAVHRALTIDHRIFLLTDSAEIIANGVPGAEVWALRDDKAVRFFKKLEIFSMPFAQHMTDRSVEDVLYLDLDALPVGNMDALIHNLRAAPPRTRFTGAEILRMMRETDSAFPGALNAGVMYFRLTSAVVRVYRAYTDNRAYIHQLFSGRSDAMIEDQGFLVDQCILHPLPMQDEVPDTTFQRVTPMSVIRPETVIAYTLWKPKFESPEFDDTEVRRVWESFDD